MALLIDGGVHTHSKTHKPASDRRSKVTTYKDYKVELKNRENELKISLSGDDRCQQARILLRL